MPSLEIGGGKNPAFPDYTQLDFRANVGADYVQNLLEIPTLPFIDDNFEKVYAQYVLEHLKKDQALSVISEVLRVLKPGGEFHVLVPDLRTNFEQMQRFWANEIEGQWPDWSFFLQGIYGDGRDWNTHYTGWIQESLFSDLLNAGFGEVYCVDPNSYLVPGHEHEELEPLTLYVVAINHAR